MSKKRQFFNDGYINSQKYAECQLVTLINAAIHLGEASISPNSEEYERLVDISLARYGAAIRAEYAMDYLRLECINTDPGWETMTKSIDDGYPVEYGIWHAGVGFHSVLVVGYTAFRSKPQVRVANFSSATDEHMWMDWDEFKPCWHFLSNWEARYYRLNKEREYQLMQKKMAVMGYPNSWFHHKHKKFGGVSPAELVRSGRPGIEVVKAEIERRVGWSEKGRRREISRLVSKMEGEQEGDFSDIVVEVLVDQTMEKFKDRFLELAEEAGVTDRLKEEIAKKSR